MQNEVEEMQDLEHISTWQDTQEQDSEPQIHPHQKKILHQTSNTSKQ
jgi:hypothetical protein